MERRLKQTTKKERIIELYDEGLDIEFIAEALETNPSYVANTIAEAGFPVPYFDLYTSTSATAGSKYGRAFAGILRFKDLESAKESVQRIDEMYHRYKRAKDRRGQHQAQMTALIGKNRAAGIGKTQEAGLFADWLKYHLDEEE